jgi:hypothetical protein
MKKIFVLIAVVFAIGFTAVPARAASAVDGDVIVERLALYFPNLIADAFDSFTVNLGFGAVAEARLMATRACDVGAGWGMAAKAFKAHNRQYGFGIEEGWYWSLVCIGEESYAVRESTSLVDRYIEVRAGFPSPSRRCYDVINGSRDYWAFGGALGLLIDGEVYLHPVELADFVLGLFLIDIKDDNFTFDSFR